MTLDHWLLILVAILTGALALAGSWFGSRLGKTTEHEQWIRNEKMKAYGGFLGAVKAAQRGSEPGPVREGYDPLGPNGPMALMSELNEKQGLVHIFGTEMINKLASDMTVAVGVLAIALSETYRKDKAPEEVTRMIVAAREGDKVAFEALVNAIQADLDLN